MEVPGGVHQPADHALQRVPQQQQEVELRAAGPVHQNHGRRVAGVLLTAVNEVSRLCFIGVSIAQRNRAGAGPG